MLRLFVAVLFIILAGSAADAASCPRDRDGGKRLTITGTISKIGKTYGGEHAISIRECELLQINAKKLNGCLAGRKIKAVGSLLACDEESFWMGLCNVHILDGSRVTCR